MLKKLEELLDKAADGDKEVNLEFLCGEALYWIRRLERDREDFVGVTNYQLVLRKSEEEMAEFIVNAMNDICKQNSCYEDPDRPCLDCVLNWLKMEVE